MTIDHAHTDEIICPYCGDEYPDAWEFEEDAGDLECGSCEKEFAYQRHRAITYTTYPNPLSEDKEE